MDILSARNYLSRKLSQLDAFCCKQNSSYVLMGILSARNYLSRKLSQLDAFCCKQTFVPFT
jgi:hypothetical protein